MAYAARELIGGMHAHCALVHVYYHYLRRRLTSEGIVPLGVTLCVCPKSRLYHVSTARRISLGGEGNALYTVLSSSICCFSINITGFVV